MKEYRFKINGKNYEVAVAGIKDGKASVTVNGTDYSVECGLKENIAAMPAPVAPVAAKPGTAAAPAAAARPAPADNAPSKGKVIDSPLPGVIIGLYASPGQAIKRGQKIAILEAMKMENDILAPKDGTVGEVFVQKGDSVLEGAKIATIE